LIKDIILLSGPVACGKSTLASELERRYNITRLKTRTLIKRLVPNVPEERAALQAAGDKLDQQTRGEWIASALQKMVPDLEPGRMLLVDAVRIPRQVAAIRRAFHPRVLHIHLIASAGELERRFKVRAGDHTQAMDELPSYAAVQKNKTEKTIDRLANDADVVIDTDRCRAADVLVRAAAHLGFYGRTYERLVDVLIGGAYGSEGKGQIVSYLAHEYDYIVRVGGPNAGHKVWMDGGPYAFHILPSGAFHSQAKLIIGPGAVISVEQLRKEIADVDADTDRLFIDPQAMIIEPEDIDWEKEHLVNAIGSTGQGVGHATARRILGRRSEAVRLARDVAELNGYTRHPIREVLDGAFFEGKRVLLEGTQGTGLSLYHGEYPYVTSRDSSVGGCLAEAGIAPSRVRKIILVVRTYPIRVQSPEGGTSGKMGTEITWEIVAGRAGLNADDIKEAEKTTTTKRGRRVAEFNWELLRLAASLNAPTDIALTFADYLHKRNKNAHRYEQLTTPTIRLVEEIERVAAAPVSLISTGFGRRVIIDRRTW
jgi:adenylosuccinate synthase